MQWVNSSEGTLMDGKVVHPLCVMVVLEVRISLPSPLGHFEELEVLRGSLIPFFQVLKESY